MEYLPLFLLFAVALIAGWFYLQRAKVRDSGSTDVDVAATPAPATEPTTEEQR